MGFVRRKSLISADAEEGRVRNRLTKPMTSKSPSPRSSLGKSSSKGSQHTSIRTSGSSQLSLQEIARTMSRKESRILAKEYLLETQQEDKPEPPVKDVSKKLGVASLVMQFEAAASSQQSLPKSVLPSRSTTSLYTSNVMGNSPQRQHMHNVLSREQLKSLRHSVSDITSSNDCVENDVDPFAIPKRRESLYRPGEATRKPSAESQDNQITTVTEEKSRPDTDKPLPPIQNERNAERAQRQWTTSPLFERTETPSDFKAIGKLKLGSLHVVNGRSSPVLSELSKHLISRQLRDVSSEYADSTYSKDLWEDADIAEDLEVNVPDEVDEPRTPTRASLDVDPRQFSTPIGNLRTPEQATPPSLGRHIQSPDKTSIMAQNYIKELRSSPFSYRSPSPSSTGSVIHHEDDNGDSATSSETHADGLNERSMSLKSDQPSMESKPSEVETVESRELVFTSALEFQAPHFQPPPSPERTVSPESSKPHRTARPSDKVDSGYNSGTSMHSLVVNEVKKEEKQAPLQIDTTLLKQDPSTQESSSKDTLHRKERSPRKLGRFFPFRPAMPKSQISAPIVMTVSTMQPRALALESGSDEAITLSPKVEALQKVVTRKEEASPKTKRKLQKERPQSRSQSKTRAWSKTRESKEIVVQRLPSSASSLDVPAIPNSARLSLQQRCEQVPELERTFKSQNHTGLHPQPSMSNLALPTEDIRFPSPYPNSDEDRQSPRNEKRGRDRSKNRKPRSKSRRRSFLDMFRSEKDANKREVEISKAETQMSIADFGDVVTMLGANPYAIAQSKPRTPGSSPRKPAELQTETHDTSVDKARHRLSMTDVEASEFARTRSHSIGSHGERTGRKHLPDDRGGIPGKYLRTSLMESDVPPMPPLPNQTELKRMSLRHGTSSPFAITPTRIQQSQENTPASSHPRESSPAPMLPDHSPRPSFVDHDYEAEYAVEDEIEPAPPPPSHSPAPIDISAFVVSHPAQPTDAQAEQRSESPWSAQARAWKERRLSAGERLKSHRKSLDLRGNDLSRQETELAVDDDDGPIYPVIPPRHPGRNDYRYQEPGHWMSNSNGYDEYGHQFDVRRSQTWDESAHDPYRFDHRRSQYSGSSFQNRQQRHNTWDDAQHYAYEDSLRRFSNRPDYGSRQSMHKSRASIESRQSFYSHNNCPIDRPFDSQARLVEDSDDEYEYHQQYSTPLTSPVRGRGRHRQDYDYSAPNGYERPYFQGQDAYLPSHSDENQYDHGYTQSTTDWFQSPEQPHYQLPAVPARQPSPIPSFQDLPHSLQISRPSSRASIRSTTPAITAVDELHLDVDLPPQIPESSSHSNGFDFGYGVHGNSAGNNTGHQKVIKRKELPKSYAFDFGNMPVVGGLR